MTVTINGKRIRLKDQASIEAFWLENSLKQMGFTPKACPILNYQSSNGNGANIMNGPSANARLN